jgi:hypothetical protein
MCEQEHDNCSQEAQVWIFPRISNVLCRWYKGSASGGIKVLKRIHLLGSVIAVPSILGFANTSGVSQAMLLLLADIGLILATVPILCDIRVAPIVASGLPENQFRSGLIGLNFRIGVMIFLIWTPCSFFGALWFLLSQFLAYISHPNN